MKQFYASPYDVDFYVGTHVETLPPGSFVSPTSACVINEQFYRFAMGDTYYYNNPNNPNPFTSGTTDLLKIN